MAARCCCWHVTSHSPWTYCTKQDNAVLTFRPPVGKLLYEHYKSNDLFLGNYAAHNVKKRCILTETFNITLVWLHTLQLHRALNSALHPTLMESYGSSVRHIQPKHPVIRGDHLLRKMPGTCNSLFLQYRILLKHRSR